jgi:hypothetical protein
MPEQTVAPVTVIPKPAWTSKTLWLADSLSYVGGALALLPELVADPLVVAWMNETMSPGARRTVAIVALGIGLILRRLRKGTTSPIIGTPAAAAAEQLNEP